MLGIVRVILVSIAIAGVVLGGCLSSAHARLGESLVGFGEELAKWTHAKRDSREGLLSVNGLEVHRMTASTSLSVRDALDRLQGVCKARGGIETSTALLRAQRVDPKKRFPGVLNGSFRRDSDNEGVLACIDTDKPLGISELAPRLRQFAQTGDLSEVGKLRYVLARREGTVTSLMVLWTEGNAPLLKMFPKTGDAPGNDMTDVPRPDRSERLLSATELSAPYGIAVYRSLGLLPSALRDSYSAKLKELGWHIAKSANTNSFAARRGTRTIVVHLAPTASGQVTTSITELS